MNTHTAERASKQYGSYSPPYSSYPAPPGRQQYPPVSGTYHAPVDLTMDEPPPKRSRKRKSDSAADLDEKASKQRSRKRKSDADDVAAPDGKAAKKPKKSKDETGEKRSRRYRDKPPQSYAEIRYRALTQRMFVIDRKRNAPQDESPTAHPTEEITLAGTTGNVYTITIDKVPQCNCPHARKGNQCKHIVYVMARVLRAPENLEYQLALLSSELKNIFASAPPLPSETGKESEKDGNRKPLDDPCPICFEDFSENSKEDVVYCKAACGNNIHRECFGQWAATKRGGAVTCPFCRSPWPDDDGAGKLGLIKAGTRTNKEGYVNVATQLGLSGRRDYSTYHDQWVRQQARQGLIDWEDY